MEIMEVIIKAKEKESHDRLVDLAFHAWLTIPFREPVTFEAYLESCGLKKSSLEFESKEDSLKTAEEVLEQLKGVEATHGTI